MSTPRRNRVTPFGEIVATPLRGAWLGNRGILHEGTRIVRFHASDLWITCALSFRDWHLAQWQPHHFTVLFLHDEAVSLAAGHRPCALCRRREYDTFRRAFADSSGMPLPSAKDLDRRLHSERIVRGTHRRRLHGIPWPEVPQGSFVVVDEAPCLVTEDALVSWTPLGYGPGRPRRTAGDAVVLTPPTSVAALRGGYRPQLATPEPPILPGIAP